MKRAVIYGLVCPLKGQVRYIGKTDDEGRRLTAHIGEARHGRGTATNKRKWIASLLRRDMKPTMTILQVLEDGADWEAAERAAIAEGHARGWPLVNSTLGGEGACLTGEALKAKTERMRREDTRRKMSESAKARFSDPVRRAEFQASASSEEKRAKLSEAAKRRATPEYRAAAAARTKAIWADPEKRLRIVSGITPESKEKAAMASRRAWSDPAKASAMIANLQRPEVLARMAEVRATEEHRLKLQLGQKRRHARTG